MPNCSPILTLIDSRNQHFPAQFLSLEGDALIISCAFSHHFQPTDILTVLVRGSKPIESACVIASEPNKLILQIPENYNGSLSDQRKSVRYDLFPTLSGQLVLRGAHGQFELNQVQVLDISQHGFKIESESDLKHSEYTLHISRDAEILSDWYGIVVVAYQHDGVIGLQLVRCEEDARKRLRETILQLQVTDHHEPSLLHSMKRFVARLRNQTGRGY